MASLTFSEEDERIKLLRELMSVSPEQFKTLATCPVGRANTTENINPLKVALCYLFDGKEGVAETGLDLDVQPSNGQLE